MAHTETWVPGTITQIEHSDRPYEIHRKGWGTFIKQHSGVNWFHFPVALPYVLLDAHLVCTTVFVFHRATDGPFISNVHVYSGKRRVQAFDGLRVAGDNTEIMDSHPNYWILEPHAGIDAGLGISVGVDFQDGGEILFTGAGAHLKSGAG